MRTLLKIWAIPIVALVLWYVLSVNDINFGTKFLSRETNDEFFRVYSSLLGVEREELPQLFWKALLVDVWLVAGFIAFRKRKVLVPWIRETLLPAMHRFSYDETGKSIDLVN